MKTITELNSKVWYRFFKVVAVIVLLLAVGISIAVSFYSVGDYQTDYLIKCNYGSKSTFLASKDKEIYIPSYQDYSQGLTNLPDSAKKEIQTACAISKNEINAKMDSIFNGTDDGKALFELTPTKIPTATYMSASMWSLLSIVIILVVFEIARRAFYYIVLGSFKPEKY